MDKRWILETSRLGFRPLSHEDHGALAPILGDVQTMYAWEYGFSSEQITQWIDACLTRYANEGYAYFAAIDKQTGELIGVMGPLNEDIDGHVHLGIGYIVAKCHWGKGYATEGAQGWVQYAFDILGAESVIADIRPENTASRNVAKRLGMRQIGQHIKHVGGKDMLHIIYALEREKE
ncbi:GNAT family N-acetyltransferase [Oscillospiraceae bacterium MB08-C2-2]|nr:GNAT family N-acetyltransferase [Oscillospiraceae bacterium MB08-C2-2]